ncbi:MAG: hypothetical protein JWN03_1861 [Nocardia sp.]|uniref:hypothetical protein n=1 Tax=Nocardia sp. TaxID=1821 RepID=UPI0026243E5D|nr:hypothetical protein [Nocardia sp.]MCU1641586.1 hypothetical protein [Nocardia sp.]
MSPDYHRPDDLWTQNTEVFEVISDDYEPVQPAPSSGFGSSRASRYTIIGLIAALACGVLVLGAVLLHQQFAPNNSGASAAPARATTVPVAPTTVARTTTVAPTTTDDPTTTSPATTTTTPTTTSVADVAVHQQCTTPGQTITKDTGVILTCDTAGDGGYVWLQESTAVVGSLCNTNEAGTFRAASDGSTLLCAPGGDGRLYQWRRPGALPAVSPAPGAKCNSQRDHYARSASGSAIWCQPDGHNSTGTAGTWQPVS